MTKDGKVCGITWKIQKKVDLLICLRNHIEWNFEVGYTIFSITVQNVNTVEPEYNDHPWDPKLAAVVQWSLYDIKIQTGGRQLK